MITCDACEEKARKLAGVDMGPSPREEVPPPAQYLVQMKMPDWSLSGEYSDGAKIDAASDVEATEKGRQMWEERRRLGQDAPGFRVLRIVHVEVCSPQPKHRPADCGFSNEDLECLGCGMKLGLIKDGHCYKVEGSAALEH